MAGAGHADLFGARPIEVELDAYAIADNHRVYKCSPGKTYRFYEVVRAAEVAFPDIRGLADLEMDASNWDDDRVLKTIASDRWARELESRARNNKHKSGSDAVSTPG